MPSKNGSAGAALSVELPESILQVIAQAASANSEIAQRLIGYLEGGGHDVAQPWHLVISVAAMVQQQAVAAKP